MVDVQPKSIVCKTTQTVKLRCKVKNVEDPLPKFIWNQYLNGVHIRRLHGEDHYHVSVLSIAYCSYQDLGNYSCTVACNGRNMTSTAYVIVQGKIRYPIILRTTETRIFPLQVLVKCCLKGVGCKATVE